jgi:hypothetical protein
MAFLLTFPFFILEFKPLLYLVRKEPIEPSGPQKSNFLNFFEFPHHSLDTSVSPTSQRILFSRVLQTLNCLQKAYPFLKTPESPSPMQHPYPILTNPKNCFGLTLARHYGERCVISQTQKNSEPRTMKR